MPLIQCPHCKKIIAKTEGDYVHTCNSGRTVLDQEDRIDITNKNWNYLGAANKASVTAQVVDGVHLDDKTERGANQQTHYQRQHQEFIN